MNQPEPRAQTCAPDLFTARVQAASGAQVMVEAEDGPCPARRAASCLIAPLPGDLALLTRTELGECYLLAVLESAQPGPARLEATGDLDISAPCGSLGISARDGLAIETPAKATATTGELEVNAGSGRLCFGGLALAAGSLRAQFDRARLAAQTLEQACGRVIANLRSRITRVEGLDQLEAATIRQRAEDLISQESRYALVSAEEDIKVDGAMIHLG